MTMNPCIYCRKDTTQEFDGYAIHHFCMNHFNNPEEFTTFAMGKEKQPSILEKGTVHFDEISHLIEDCLNDTRFTVMGRDIDSMTLHRAIYVNDPNNGRKYCIKVEGDDRFGNY